MIGAVAKCRQGKVGVICHMQLKKTENKGNVLYTGVTLDGKAWQSIQPEILASNLNEYIIRFLLPMYNENPTALEIACTALPVHS